MSHTKEPFEREERYIVIKIKDLKYISVENKLRSVLAEAGIPTRECVVVEPDWPEFDLVWSMIEARMTGTGNDHRRIVACVNACVGYSNEALEQPGGFMQTLGNALDEIEKLKQQRDDLLAAWKESNEALGLLSFHCDGVVGTANPPHEIYNKTYDIYRRHQAAIAKVRP